jgi:hypothetical protein
MLIKCEGISVSLEENEEIRSVFSGVEVARIYLVPEGGGRMPATKDSVIFEIEYRGKYIQIPLSRVNYIMYE